MREGGAVSVAKEVREKKVKRFAGWVEKRKRELEGKKEGRDVVMV